MEQIKTPTETHPAQLYDGQDQLPGATHDLSQPVPEGVIATSEPGSSVEKWQQVGDVLVPIGPLPAGDSAELISSRPKVDSHVKLPKGVITLVGPMVPGAREKSPYRSQDIIGGSFNQQPVQSTKKAA